MPFRSFTLAQLRSRLQKLTDTENDTHLSTTELNEILSSSVAETWDLIVGAGLADQFVKSASFNTVANQLEYDLTSASYVPAQDFYKIHQLYVDEGSGQLRPVPRINPAEVQNFRSPQTVVPIKLYYIPISSTFKTGASFDDTLTFDGINGWEEHALMTAACAVKLKRDEDYRQYASRKEELERRIRASAGTDWSQPARVVRRRHRALDPFMLFRNNINAYVVRGGKLELLYYYGYIP